MIKTSQYKGVHWNRNIQKWHSKITINEDEMSLGYFEDERKAALAYDRVAVKHYRKANILKLVVRG